MDATETIRRSVSRRLAGEPDEVLAREWLLTNGRGGFAAGTVAGCPTRRYHAYLVTARQPPVDRFATLAGTLERVSFEGMRYDLATVEAPSGFHFDSRGALHDFQMNLDRQAPWVEWRWRLPHGDVSKRLTLHHGTDLLTLSYTVSAVAEVPVRLEIVPAVVLRGFHATRDAGVAPDWRGSGDAGGLFIEDEERAGLTLGLMPSADRALDALVYEGGGSRLEKVFYRVEADRGYFDCDTWWLEGRFHAEGERMLRCTLEVGAGATSLEAMRRMHRKAAARRATRPSATGRSTAVDRLTLAADQFIVQRAQRAQGAGGGQGCQATIMAGYPWFGDWGRDAFIALEGLCLCTGRFAEAREVLGTFGSAQRNGLIPNLFDDYGGECHYNSVDASLWYIHAADRYLDVSGDEAGWDEFLSGVCRNVLEAYAAGTDFEIGLDDDGLLRCGDPDAQITWMDAKCGGVVFTPRHGKPVEVNALWYHVLRIAEQRFAAGDAAFAAYCGELAGRCRHGFVSGFWRADGGGLCDVIRPDERDASVRPNQIFAVSLAHSPLSLPQQRRVVEVVADTLLTPYGLRSLSPEDAAYRGRYYGALFERDAAYHQGTVWSWLMGPFVEAYLRVQSYAPAACERVEQLVRPLLAHLDEAGLGSVSEIFEGDRPHGPRGCTAQAWSVAELLRVLRLLEEVRAP